MFNKKPQEKKRVLGKGRIALMAAVTLAAGFFFSFTMGNLGSYTLAGSGEERRSEVIIRKSALVWRTDGNGDYSLPSIAAGENYEIPEAVKTEGEIKTITASWEFTGEVRLEVSANNGVDYTAVVNGVSLDLAHSSQLMAHSRKYPILLL